MSDSFALHARLAADTHLVAELPLSTLLLSSDARFPWCILVPRLANLADLPDVPPEHHGTLFQEIGQVSRALTTLTGTRKINVAALGNIVPQLHVHIVARFPDDAAWPGPIWGVGEATTYSHQRLTERLEGLRGLL